MPTCEYCLGSDFATDTALARHQAHAALCRERRDLATVARVARLVPQLHSDSESDPDFSDVDDGFGHIHAEEPLDDAFFDVPEVARSPSFFIPAPTSGLETNTSTPDEPDDEGYIQIYSHAAKVYEKVLPPIQTQYASFCDNNNPFAPFISEEDWELARWAKSHAITDSSLTSLLGIKGLRDGMNLSFKDARGLNTLIDGLPLPAKFQHTSITVHGYVGAYDVYHCDPLEVLRELLADPTFEDHVTWAATRLYDSDKKSRLWSEMTSGDWMWEMQGKIQLGGTVIPILISTDKTQLTAFSGDHSAYPVYMSIGNIAKHVRRMPSQRAFRLIGYLPTVKPDETTMSDNQARIIRQRLFHKAMEIICKPLFESAQNGVMLPDSKGNVRKCFPILASYIADYPKQCLVTCVRYGQTCPKCHTSVDQFGKHVAGTPREQKETIAAITRARNARTAAERDKILQEAGINNIVPFWALWPHVNIHQCITPDNLHQTIQGVGAHLVQWLSNTMGEKELDARLARLPPAHNLRHFARGISCLSRVSGAERKAIYAQILGGVIGRVPREAVRAARALLDFIYTAQFECHSVETLKALENALDEFHKYKDVFVKADPTLSFDFPKLHMLEHYVSSIRQTGTTDNCDTQATERMHIEFAKDAFKATNKREYVAQMCRWLQRRQAVHQFAVYLAWRQGEKYDARRRKARKPTKGPVVLADKPPVKKTIVELEGEHGITDFRAALKIYLQEWHSVSHRFYDMDLPRAAAAALASIKKLDVWYHVKFLTPDLQTLHAPDVLDIAHAYPQRYSAARRVSTPARFDTVLVELNSNAVAGASGLEETRVARLRALFRVPDGLAKDMFAPKEPPAHLAFVEWFNRPTRRDPDSKLPLISRCFTSGSTREVGIVEIVDLRRSCHLFPAYGRDDVDRSLESATILDAFNDFYLNDGVDKHAYRTM